MKKVLIIGGGPVGLMTAYNLSRMKKKYQITIYDKRIKKERTRDQIVVLNPSSIRELPNKVQNSKCLGYVNPVEYDQSGSVFPSSHGKQMSTQLKYLELELLSVIEKIKNIKIIYEKLEEDDIRKLLKENKDTIFIGSDGYNSLTRSVLGCDVISCTSSYGIVALFESNHRLIREDIADVYSKKSINFKNITGIPQHRYRGFRSPIYNETRTCHISVQLTKDEFESIDQSLIKKSITGDKLPENIYDLVKSGGHFYNMTLPSPENIRIFVLPIRVFNAAMVTHKIDKNLVLLLGDAANGPNFISMSGVNKGIKMARELSKIIRTNDSIDYIYKNYEKRVEYILTDTINMAFNYTLDEKTTDMLYNKYSDDKLDNFGYQYNLYLDGLPKREKCFIISELFSHGVFIDDEIRNTLSCRMLERLNKINDKVGPTSPPCYCY